MSTLTLVYAWNIRFFDRPDERIDNINLSGVDRITVFHVMEKQTEYSYQTKYRSNSLLTGESVQTDDQTLDIDCYWEFV